MKSYSIHYHKYNIFANNYVRYIQDVVTDDIYHEVGKIICSSLERISKISYTLNKDGITQDICDIRYESGFTRLDRDTWIDETKVFDIYSKKVWEKEDER